MQIRYTLGVFLKVRPLSFYACSEKNLQDADINFIRSWSYGATHLQQKNHEYPSSF